MKIHRRWLLPIAAAGFLISTAPVIRATPYASGITNNNGTIQFYINESGGNCTVTYEDSTTATNFDGVDTGTNLPAGPYSFSLAGHTSYTISIFKVGAGVPSLVPTPFQTPHTFFFSKGTFRGIDVNRNISSPNFGRIYICASGGSPPLYCLNADGSLVTSNTAGITWNFGGLSPYRISVAPDDSILAGDLSSGGAGIWRITPDLTSGQLLLGPLGDQKTNLLGQIIHGEIFSKPLINGPLTNNLTATLMEIDSDYPANDPNAVLEYTNVATNSLPYEKPPTVGPEIGLNFQYLSNVYPGLTQGGSSNYIYASNFRNNFAVPTVDVLDPTGTTVLWNSLEAVGGPDFFVTSDPFSNAGPQGPIDSAISPDGNYFVAMAIDNHLTVCQVTNGIPNGPSATVIDTLYDSIGFENGRGVCFDAADNIYLVSSGTALAQSWTLGQTTTTTTTGNANGVTSFVVSYPTFGSVTASNAVISQPNPYSHPTSTFFVITLASAPTNTVTVSYSFSGTALGVTNGSVSYPATFTANPPSSVVFAPGQTQGVVTITSVSDSTPRPTTTLNITLGTTATFDPQFPTAAAISILNTAPQELFVTEGSPTMYNAFSNDYGSMQMVRWGDINASQYTVSSFSVIGGTGVEGTDYAAPGAVVFHPGDLTNFCFINPLQHGQVPVHTNSMTFAGNKTAILSVVNAAGYTVVPNTNTFTIVDSANPPATVLYYDPLTNSAPTNWIIRPTDENYPITAPDYFADFGYNLAADSRDPDLIAIANPPNGQPTALRITTGKSGSVGNQTTYSTAVNLYLTNTIFSGDYAVRFNMNITEAGSFGTSGSFEGPLFGINCSGNQTNFYLNGSPSAPANSHNSQTNFVNDGVWVWMTDDAFSQYDPYTLFAVSGTNNPKSIGPASLTTYTPFVNNFKSAVFANTPGLPANGSPDNSAFNPPYTNVWADVELKQYVAGSNCVITFSIDKTPILVYTNTTPFTNGTVMLGYETPVFGGDAPDGAVYYSDLKVVQLGPPTITQFAYNKGAGTFTFNFTSPDGSVTTSQLVVVGSATVNGTYTAVPGATVTSLGNGNYLATAPLGGPIEFYRIQQLYR